MVVEMRALLVLILLMGLALPVQAATSVVWEDLKDPAAARFDDPFAALSISELRLLGTVLRLRKRLADSDVSPEARPRMEQRLENEEAKLAVRGVDTDGLLAQRKTIARKHAEGALAGNPALSGQDVTITGYVIPVLDEDGSARSGYLVPEYGMCSHVPAPDPNQMIRYDLNTDWQAEEIYQRVRLSGRIGLRMTRQTINLLDGEVEMISAFEMDVRNVEPVDYANPSIEDRSFRSFIPPKPGLAQPSAAN